MTCKKIAIIGTVGLPAKYGGFESFTEFLVENLSSRFDFTVYCSGRTYTDRRTEYKGASLKYLPLKANGMQSIPYDVLSILDAIRYADTLLVLGVGGCSILPLLRLLGCHKRIVVNIDGLEWRRDKWSVFAKWILKYSEKRAVKYADSVVGDNKVIADYVTNEYNKHCELIEYGADHQGPRPITEEARRLWPFLNASYAFGVCRIEPENNIRMVLEAFAKDAALPLVMVGNWQQSEYGINLYQKYENNPNIYLIDPIYEIEQLNILRSNCSFYIHGHMCGGTNPSLIEAMYLGLTIVAFDVNFNRESTENKAFYFSDAAGLRALLTNKHESERCRRDMKLIAERRYTWHRIANLYASLF